MTHAAPPCRAAEGGGSEKAPGGLGHSPRNGPDGMPGTTGPTTCNAMHMHLQSHLHVHMHMHMHGLRLQMHVHFWGVRRAAGRSWHCRSGYDTDPDPFQLRPSLRLPALLPACLLPPLPGLQVQAIFSEVLGECLSLYAVPHACAWVCVAGWLAGTQAWACARRPINQLCVCPFCICSAGWRPPPVSCAMHQQCPTPLPVAFPHTCTHSHTHSLHLLLPAACRLPPAARQAT